MFLLDKANARVIIGGLGRPRLMAPKKEDDDSQKKRIIEFDMFVRDLEPEQDEKIRGGGKSGEQQKPDDRKTDRQ